VGRDDVLREVFLVFLLHAVPMKSYVERAPESPLGPGQLTRSATSLLEIRAKSGAGCRV